MTKYCKRELVGMIEIFGTRYKVYRRYIKKKAKYKVWLEEVKNK